MPCIKCKKELQPDFIWCPYCGKKQLIQRQKGKSHGNGIGTVFKRDGDKSWTAEYTAGWALDESGKAKRVRKTKRGFKTSKEAQAFLADLRVEKEEPKKIAAKTVREMYDSYYNTAMTKLSATKQDAYRIAFKKRIEPAIGDMAITEVGLDALDPIVAKLTFYTAKDVRDLMSILFQRAMADGLLTINPTRFMTMPENNSEEIVPWEPEEIEKLWGEWGNSNRVAGTCLLMIYSGMMPGELFKCKKDMINWEQNTIIGCGLKTKKRKELPIVFPDFIAPILKELCDTSPSKDGYVLGMNRDNFYDRFRDMKAKLGIRDNIRPYSSRHSTGTSLELMGVSPGIIIEIMRHKNYSVTLEHYIKIPTDRLVSSLNMLQPGSNHSAENGVMTQQ